MEEKSFEYFEAGIREALNHGRSTENDLRLCLSEIDRLRKRDETGKHAVEWYGSENQDFIAMEEMGELITALSHFRRGRVPSEAVCEEIADVLVALESMKYTYGEERIEQYVLQKKNRLLIRIGLDMAAQKSKP